MIDLWDNQKIAAPKLLSGEICALWWQMRTGKTLAAIAGTDDGDRLIICPNGVKGVWKNDLALYGQEAYIWDISRKSPKARPRNVIVNYESVWRGELLSWNWDSYVFDESIRLQSLDSKLFWGLKRNMRALEGARRRICLSGSPCPEGFHQLIAQSWVCTGQYCGISDPWQALRTFFTYDSDTYRWKINKGHAKQAKKQMADLGYSLTQLDAGITTKKLYRTIQVPTGTIENAIWNSIDKSSSPGILGMYAQSAASGRPIKGEITSSNKLDAVIEYVNEFKEQVVIITRFTESLKYLSKKLPEAKCMYGEDFGIDYRNKVKDDFANGKLQIIIANEKVVKVGLNLSAAAVLIFAENDWSGESRIQAEERGTVKGKPIIEIIDFVSVGENAVGMIDQHILTAVRAKKDFNADCMKFIK